jgi:hypothetical protein
LIPRALKEALVRHPLRAKGLYPTLIASRDGETVAMCDLQACWAERSNVLREVVAVLAPDEVVVVVEALMSLPPDIEASGDALSERFHDGDPTVSEAIDVLRMTRSGEGERVLHPYSCSGDTVTWGEAVHLGRPGGANPTGRVDDDIAGSLSAGFGAAGKPSEPDEARAALKALGVRVRFLVDPDPFIDVVPGDPCPCGSGRKHSDCHGY